MATVRPRSFMDALLEGHPDQLTNKEPYQPLDKPLTKKQTQATEREIDAIFDSNIKSSTERQKEAEDFVSKVFQGFKV
jgi:hypothetical protein